jgi:hypothetical protein
VQSQTLTIKFPSATVREANKYAQDLADGLQEVEGVTVERRRDNADSQDFGATLILILGTTSITAIAHGLSKWLSRNSGAKVEIIMPDGRKALMDNLNSSDVPGIVKAISGQPNK